MPKVFDWRGYRFHFYSDEGDPREPPHVHVRKGRNNAKFWLRPFVSVAYNCGFGAKEIGKLAAQVRDRRDEIEKAWHEYFS